MPTATKMTEAKLVGDTVGALTIMMRERRYVAEINKQAQSQFGCRDSERQEDNKIKMYCNRCNRIMI